MPPHHVRTLGDYWTWLEKVVDESGGWLTDTPSIVIQPMLDEEQDDRVTGLLVLRQPLAFHDATLRIYLIVDEELEAEEYHFDFRETSGKLIWRKDKHGGHEADVGGLPHIHNDSDDEDNTRPFPEVDLQEAVDQVHSHYEGRSWMAKMTQRLRGRRRT